MTPPVEVPAEVPVETQVEVLGDVELRAVNVAVIPPIEYGRPATAAVPADSSPLPLISLLVALAILLLLLALLALRSQRRRSA